MNRHHIPMYVLGLLLSFTLSSVALFGCETLPEPDPEQTTKNRDGGSSTEHSTYQDTTSPSVQALPTSSFIYVHYPEKGKSIGHVYVYDKITKKSRRITDLDNTTRSPRITLSPDRKWFALVAFFRPNAVDIAQKIAIPSIWLVRIDGKVFKRITEPLINGDLKRGKCQLHSECPVTKYCNTSSGTCQREGFSMGLGKASWSHDKKTLWTSFSQHWSEGGRIAGGVVPASVPVAGGVVALQAVTSGCQQVSNTSADPTSPRLIANHSVCLSGAPGLHSYPFPPKKGTKLFSEPNISTPIGDIAWLSDGSGILFLANSSWDTNGDKKPDINGIGIAGYQFSTKTITAILPPLKTHLSYTGLSPSPDNKQIALCVNNSQTGTSDLYMLDTLDKKTPFKQITQDGKSCNPSW